MFHESIPILNGSNKMKLFPASLVTFKDNY